MSGIYQIYNPINNKRYIGSSINVERRLKEHLRNLEKNRHCNDHLQSAYNKYKDVLQFQFLEECEPDECLIFEQYYLDYYKSYIREFGYNIDPEAKYAGKHLSEETKEKIRQKALCKKISKETIEKIRLKNLGKKRPKQSDKMKNRWDITKQYFGYNCMSEEKKKEIIDKIRVKTIERYKDYRNKKNNIFIKAIFDNGECKYFYAYKDASRQLKIDKGSIRYAFKFKNGRCDKIKATFVKITEKEYKNKSKK